MLSCVCSIRRWYLVGVKPRNSLRAPIVISRFPSLPVLGTTAFRSYFDGLFGRHPASLLILPTFCRKLGAGPALPMWPAGAAGELPGSVHPYAIRTDVNPSLFRIHCSAPARFSTYGARSALWFLVVESGSLLRPALCLAAARPAEIPAQEQCHFAPLWLYRKYVTPAVILLLRGSWRARSMATK